MAKTKSVTIQNNRYRNKKLIAGGGGELEFDENAQCTCDADLAERLSKMKGFSIVTATAADTAAAEKAEKAAKAKAAKAAKAKSTEAAEVDETEEAAE